MGFALCGRAARRWFGWALFGPFARPLAFSLARSFILSHAHSPLVSWDSVRSDVQFSSCFAPSCNRWQIPQNQCVHGFQRKITRQSPRNCKKCLTYQNKSWIFQLFRWFHDIQYLSKLQGPLDEPDAQNRKKATCTILLKSLSTPRGMLLFFKE